MGYREGSLRDERTLMDAAQSKGRMKPSRGAVTIGRLSVLVGAIYILRIPLIIVMMLGVGGPLAPVLQFLHIIVGNLHWGDNLGFLKALVLDVPLAIVLIISGTLTSKGRRWGRELAYVFARLTIVIEALGLIAITLPKLRFPSVESVVVVAAIGSFISKLVYPIVLLVFYSRPQNRRQF